MMPGNSGPAYEEMARQIDGLKESELEMEGLIPVSARVSKSPRAVVSLRLTPEELVEFTAAARKHNMSFSDFMRTAASSAARGGADIEDTAAIAEVRAKARELTEALSRLRVS